MGNQQIDSISDSQTFVNANENMQEETTSHLLQTPEILLKYSMPTKNKQTAIYPTAQEFEVNTIFYVSFQFSKVRTH